VPVLGALMVGLLLAALMGGVVLCVTSGRTDSCGDLVMCLLCALALVLDCGFSRGLRDHSDGD
jgi:hypothetical protein